MPIHIYISTYTGHIYTDRYTYTGHMYTDRYTHTLTYRYMRKPGDIHKHIYWTYVYRQVHGYTYIHIHLHTDT